MFTYISMFVLFQRSEIAGLQGVMPGDTVVFTGSSERGDLSPC